MHGDDEFGQGESAPLFGISQSPYSTKSLVGQARLVEDGPGLIAWQHVRLQVLALKQGGILCNLVGSQGRNANAARDLGLDGRLRLRRRGGSSWPDAFEAGDGPLLESQLGGWLSSGLSMADEAKYDAEASGSEEAAVLLVGNLPYL